MLWKLRNRSGASPTSVLYSLREGQTAYPQAVKVKPIKAIPEVPYLSHVLSPRASPHHWDFGPDNPNTSFLLWLLLFFIIRAKFIHNTKFTILTISKCIVQWHEVRDIHRVQPSCLDSSHSSPELVHLLKLKSLCTNPVVPGNYLLFGLFLF